jgi:3-dehydroquinate synthase
VRSATVRAMSPPRTIRVRTQGRACAIHIETDALTRTGRLARGAGLASGPCAVVSDTRVARLYAKTLTRSLARAGFTPLTLLTVPPGERSKSLSHAERLYHAFARAGLERGRPVFALGGGVVGDLAGFAAATWLRGVPLVMVPTSLLAQVDSSVGGKVGVDLAEGKNLVGAFHQPHLVVIDPTVLETLPVRHVRAGLAEAAKVAWTLDRALLKALEQNAAVLRKGGRSVLARVVERCVRAKARIVSEDERDGGRRQILNYGHTAGHALEAVGGYRRWIHGEAVALGMAIAARISVRRGLIAEAVAQRQERLLAALGLPAAGRALAGVSARNVFDAMQLDKKRDAGKLRFVLTHGVGVVSFGHLVKRAEVLAALQDAGCDP